ncbi:hypothetical protein [Kibdelosporangium aridum]|uniref:Uncharacterized protein n=1 Tax=Kibdelosporangium aridum TaxID=2030 RepID=A0A1Y5WVC6_KIBAR|nr:hypothetical protein [Kibdelosporangium aridum]SMC53904.1 hypothetical protein SAMN05661093_00458 [Kibdelosporangium aridum]
MPDIPTREDELAVTQTEEVPSPRASEDSEFEYEPTIMRGLE